MRATYDAQRNERVYPEKFDFRWEFFGPEIDGDTVFDELQIECAPDRFVVGPAYLYNDGVQVSQVPGRNVNTVAGAPTHFRYFRDDPEVQIVRRKIEQGACILRFLSHEKYPLKVYTPEELHASHWLLDLLHPFHVDDRDLFFQHLTEDLSYTAPEHGEPQRFIFPGIVEGANRRYYKRDDNPQAPDTDHAAETSLALLGWTPHVPYGGSYLHAIDVLDSPASVSVSQPQRVYHRRKDQTGAIVELARAWHRYWRGLTTSEQGINVRMTLRKHVEHAIGRMWADKPFDRDIDVFHAGDSGARERSARDAEDWMLGDAEFWAHQWGFPVLALALGEGDHRSLLETQLGDYTFCHLRLDGSVGDRLSNGADGITEATWDAYQDTHYPAAVNHGVETMSVETLTIIVHREATETANLTVVGGLAPFEFELTTTASVGHASTRRPGRSRWLPTPRWRSRTTPCGCG